MNIRALWLAAPAVVLMLSCAPSAPPEESAGNSKAAGSACRMAAEPYVLREDLAAKGNAGQGELLLRFAQMSDEHIMDDDGQAVNGLSVLDPLLPALDSAMRFQDEYTDEVMNRMIATLNGCHAEQPIELVVATGDNTDLGTVAEVRRFIDNLDGTFDRMSAFETKCRAALPLAIEELAQIACTRFTGRGVADTQTPDPDVDNLLLQPVATRMLLQLQDTERAVLTGRAVDGSVDPARQTATRAPGLPQSLRCEAGAPGCENLRLAVPYYVAFGNHDGYPRGTIVSEPGLQEASVPLGRHYMQEQHEFIDEFFATGAAPGPVGHGFAHVDAARWNDADGRNDGYYAFDAGKKGRFRMIVMNTIIDGTDERIPAPLRAVKNPFALADGTVDPAQFDWLKTELAMAAAKRQLVLVFSHHPDLSFAEYGMFAQLSPLGVPAAELNAELASYPNVVAWIAGHTHRHRIRAFKVADGTGSNGVVTAPVECKGPGVCAGFWQIETASLIDFPQEARLLEFYAAGETGIIRSAVLQHDFERSKRLAEVDDRCQFYLTDPAMVEQAITDADLSTLCKQGGTRDGEPHDRNVELVFRIP
jgi:3',5'-cyclic AMP phosphodiesterase CpdA